MLRFRQATLSNPWAASLAVTALVYACWLGVRLVLFDHLFQATDVLLLPGTFTAALLARLTARKRHARP
ncbi:hypothetical protein C6N75_17765 [Streptomyces solincola]|uniref:Uncharacterized protein n=1 Tax=Streptomyces solincola TaxID=2100817 RepID=A0A2S9PTX3_9ACTN|nr:hypothetical protein [Streptomyces solincola]PRH77872.1 hypothetical protein C6N75_17765 [Streptomyces solincola]